MPTAVSEIPASSQAFPVGATRSAVIPLLMSTVAFVPVHHVCAAAEPHHEVKKPRKQQERQQAFHAFIRLPLLRFFATWVERSRRASLKSGVNAPVHLTA